MERDRDPGVLLSSVISCVSSLVIQLAEDLGDGANPFSEKGDNFMLKVLVKELCISLKFFRGLNHDIPRPCRH